ncbi:Serine/threonine-protein phosphatase 2A regulatory subunit B'' subunit alpha [Labeo rohita]|uniref:Serine/threonine-protein phosphatase 2A regulatory subunit B'' subunit alpha n=1 Tax=Labeo rohita TaxID=84645 RepID=A0ABQ8MXK7_LABRO|nr:Serine/threonine-protein phosphatase 2A regulatory subunit B'' subunit alpha [Labeo rohita]
MNPREPGPGPLSSLPSLSAFLCTLSVWGWEGASIPIIQPAHPYGHLTQLIPLPSVLVRSAPCSSGQDGHRGREREGTGPGGRPQSGSCFAGLGTLSKSNREAGGLASLVQCSWIPAVTVAGTILGFALCVKTHPPCIPGQNLANESFEVRGPLGERAFEGHRPERSYLRALKRKLNLLDGMAFSRFLLFESFDIANMMIKEASLREDPDLRGELAFLARGCDFVLPSRFKKRLKSFQQAQWKGVRQGRNTVSKCCVQELQRGGREEMERDGTGRDRPQLLSSIPPCRPAPLAVEFSKIQSHFNSSLSIQPEKKPGTPPPTLAPAPSSPTPRPPSPPPAKVVATPPPSSINIPRFYFPKGLPNCAANYDEAIAKIEAAFTEFEEEKADIYEMGKIAKACGCPLYWKAPMFICAGGERTGFVSVHSFIATWRKLLHSCYDDASRFVYLLAKPGCNYLEQEDFIPLLQVIQRIFYTVNRSWTGKINMTELRRSNFLQTLALLEEEDDINQITDYFSYEHFYVIYCKFWELDTDHDLFIDPKDLARYNDHASSSRIIERLFSGAVTRGNSVQREGRMSYAEFVWFLISEEDKKNPTSIEYWFRCMDMDGDGVLSMFELEFFYEEEQCERMEGMGIEPLPFQDLLCQMLDLVKPECPGKITLRDLKRCRMAHIFYDTFFNLEKYLDHEQRDPFAVQKDLDSDGPEPSDWDKYAAEEYEILVAEETANEQLREGSFDDDYESDELTVSSDIGNKMDKLVISDLSA